MKNNVIVRIFVILSVTLFLEKSLADTISAELKNLSEESQKIFSHVSAMCSRNSQRAILERSEIWFSAYTQSSFFASAINLTSPLKTSPYFNQLTSSIGFHLALTRCFGHDEEAKYLFFASLLALDISGKMITWAVDISLLRALYIGIRAGGNLTTKGINYQLIRNAITFAWNNPVISKLQNSSIISVVWIANIVQKAYLSYLRHISLSAPEILEKEAELLQIQKRIELSKSKLMEATSADERGILELFIHLDQRKIDELNVILSR